MQIMFSQTASQSQPVHNEVDQSKFVKHVIDKMSKRVNSSMDKNPLHKKVNKLVQKEDNVNSTYLRLNGHEEECVFSSTAPETKPTINVS